MDAFGHTGRTVSVLLLSAGVIGWSAAPALLGPTASAAVVLPGLSSVEMRSQGPFPLLLEAPRGEVEPDAVPLTVPQPGSRAELAYEIRNIEPYPTVDYKILFVQPDPTVDYKILVVEPDPTVDYKILVIDPHTKLEVNGLTAPYKRFYYRPFGKPTPKRE